MVGLWHWVYMGLPHQWTWEPDGHWGCTEPCGIAADCPMHAHSPAIWATGGTWARGAHWAAPIGSDDSEIFKLNKFEAVFPLPPEERALWCVLMLFVASFWQSRRCSAGWWSNPSQDNGLSVGRENKELPPSNGSYIFFEQSCVYTYIHIIQISTHTHTHIYIYNIHMHIY